MNEYRIVFDHESWPPLGDDVTEFKLDMNTPTYVSSDDWLNWLRNFVRALNKGGVKCKLQTRKQEWTEPE